MHAMRRLELIVEQMAHKRACRVMEAAGLTGYTVVSAIAGAGGGERWRRDDDPSASTQMMVIISIGPAEKVDAALTQMHELLGAHIGVLSVSDVQVMRPERF